MEKHAINIVKKRCPDEVSSKVTYNSWNASKQISFDFGTARDMKNFIEKTKTVDISWTDPRSGEAVREIKVKADRSEGQRACGRAVGSLWNNMEKHATEKGFKTPDMKLGFASGTFYVSNATEDMWELFTVRISSIGNDITIEPILAGLTACQASPEQAEAWKVEALEAALSPKRS